MNKQKRYNLNYRSQSTEGSALATITKWLNKESVEEKTQKINHLLIMTCMPLAKADEGASQEELKKYYWEFEQWTYHYRYILRQRLNLEGQIDWESELKALETKPIPRVEAEKGTEEEEVDEITSSNHKSVGRGKAKKTVSIFNGLG